MNVRQSERQLLSVNPCSAGLRSNPLTVLIDSLQGDGLADIRSVTRVDSNVAVKTTRHVAVRDDSPTVNKLLTDASVS
ncbi:MAG: hypothetical protein ACK55Z_12715 [bacterium]